MHSLCSVTVFLHLAAQKAHRDYLQEKVGLGTKNSTAAWHRISSNDSPTVKYGYGFCKVSICSRGYSQSPSSQLWNAFWY